MTTVVENTDYAIKPSAYFENVRPEMMSFIPRTCRCVLDVGCGTGEFGVTIKLARGAEVWGIEPFASAVQAAGTKLDKVIHGLFEPDANLPASYFDCIVFNDVLEHMLDPDAALRYARTLLAPGGVIVASIPNIRHFPTLWRLVSQGDWTYGDSGTLDKTHLRFFTRASIDAMFVSAGFKVDQLLGINAYCAVPPAPPLSWKAYRLVNALAMGRLHDLRYLQFAVSAHAA